MSCRGCNIILDCEGLDGNPTSDVSPSRGGFFPTQDYTFVLDCPKGYTCFPGYYPRVIDIPGTTIPPVTVDGNQMCLQGCLSLICENILPGTTQADLNALANFLFGEWALQQATCVNRRTGPAPGVPPPKPLGGGGIIFPKKLDVGNTEQSFTAHCNPESSGSPRTFTVSAGVYTVTLWNPTPDQISAVQAQMNATALQDAQNSAQKLLACGTCNAALHVFSDCAGSPGHAVAVDIPAGTYCFPVGSPQAQADAAANVAAVNMLNALLVAAGCVCPGPTVNPANGIICNVCTCHYRWNGYPSVGSFGIGPGCFDIRSFKCGALDGYPIFPPFFSDWTPLDCPGPHLQFYYTSANTGPCPTGAP